MSENLPNIDDLFRKALEEHEDSPSANVWANIDKNLDKKKVVSISQKYRKLKWVAAALLIFSAGMAMYTVHTRIRNRELVKQNEINKRKILRSNTPNANDNADIAPKAIENTKTDTSTNNAVVQQPIATKGDTSESTVTGVDKIRVNSNNDTNNKVEDKPIAIAGKQEKIVKDLGVKGNNRPDIKGKANLKSFNGALNNLRKDQQADRNVVVGKSNKSHGQPNEKSVQLISEPKPEKSAREVDLATVKANEKSYSISEPIELISATKSS
ncbi:MAG: hypothetical protein M3040_07900, partial [Bacteroidota bacterium]|nr:hypothetical protein [Bacteroidota bacterium]